MLELVFSIVQLSEWQSCVLYNIMKGEQVLAIKWSKCVVQFQLQCQEPADKGHVTKRKEVIYSIKMNAKLDLRGEKVTRADRA